MTTLNQSNTNSVVNVNSLPTVTLDPKYFHFENGTYFTKIIPANQTSIPDTRPTTT